MDNLIGRFIKFKNDEVTGETRGLVTSKVRSWKNVTKPGYHGYNTVQIDVYLVAVNSLLYKVEVEDIFEVDLKSFT